MSATSGSRRARPAVRPARIVLSIVGLVVAAVWFFPVYWMINSSLLSNVVLSSTTPTFFPDLLHGGGSLDNFATVFQGGSFLPALG
ncbi:MAG: carbohydrate ABC transporter permease, partial [Actinomycetota bacterium]|nr:carbohydrate ABC transporter permease [Actinomycetota bacterium]